MKRGWCSLRTVLFSVLVLLVVSCGASLVGFRHTSPPSGFCDFSGDTQPVRSYQLSVRSLVESQGTVYVTVTPLDVPTGVLAVNTRLYALHASDGTLLWQQPIQARSTVLVDQNTLYLSNLLFLEARRESSGTVLWQRREDNTWYGPEAAPPVLDQGVLSISERTSIFALRASDGQPLWDVAPGLEQPESQPDATFYSQPVVSQGRVFVGLRAGTVVALRESSGAVLWQTRVEPPLLHAPIPIAAAGGLVYVSTSQGVQVLGASDGALQGKLAGLENGLFARATVTDDVLYTTTGQTAFAVRVTDDRLLWYTPLHSDMEAPQVAHGLVYFPGASQVLQAADGSPLHPLDQTGSFQVSALGPSGVYQVTNGSLDICSPGSAHTQPLGIRAWREPDHTSLWTTFLPLPA
jgi:outer membrane protein assembly factor BamB